ncbi:MAG TPA: hypothetical protein VNE40_02550 [Candidatus Dormibacteraeota bacterium]|nr:hypothetical protein [Candidatus Dormibacteraeota bacterium]
MYRKITALVASNKFFYSLVALLVFQASWIALSGRYPMAFDEDFHFGLIRLYAYHISPFWSHQPPNASAYGAVFRDPSYLYHYLMSFPYRLINLFVHSQTSQVLILRFMNIALFSSCLPLYRRLLMKSKVSANLTHLILAFFVLIPIVPFLAAQINYDNLLLPLTALNLLLAVNISQQLEQFKQLNLLRLAQLAILSLLTSLVQYAYLPIFAAIVIFLSIQIFRKLYKRGQLWTTFRQAVTHLAPRVRWLIIVGLIISGSLFTERYGINLVRYHEVAPDCSQVLSVQQCLNYSPWIRNYNYSIVKGANLHGPLGFSLDWLYGMWLRTFFAVDGPATQFETRGPLILPSVSALVLIVFGSLSFVVNARPIFRRYNASVLSFFILISGLYIVALWLDEYRAYLHTGQPVAINGRYLLPISLFLLLLLVVGFSEALAKRKQLQLLVASLVLFCFLWGGGFLTYVLRSDPSWYWPNHNVISANKAVQTFLQPIVPGASRPDLFLR